MVAFSRCTLVLATAMAVFLGANAENDGIVDVEEVHDRELANKKRPNNAVCYEILNTWWTSRLAEKTREDLVAIDQLCDAYSEDEAACNHKNGPERAAYAGSVDTETLNAFCTMVGAHDKRCLGNPCNQLNDETCTLQETHGQCVWWTVEQIATINAYYESIGSSNRIPGHGCYRNPCNQPGYGKLTDKKCESYGNGILECTWCKGAYDAQLKGEGMGCQATIPTTSALCAPVNTNVVSKESVYVKVGNSRCQCSSTFPICQERIDTSAAGEYVPRY